jgi:hypothetical protein
MSILTLDGGALMPARKPIHQYRHVVTVGDVSSARSSALHEDTIAIVERSVPRWAVFRCPCGCGELLTINLDPRTGPHWRLLRSRSRVSLSPSVWRTSGCHSHFILWKNRVWLFRPWRLRGRETLPRDVDPELLREWGERYLAGLSKGTDALERSSDSAKRTSDD